MDNFEGVRLLYEKVMMLFQKKSAPLNLFVQQIIYKM